MPARSCVASAASCGSSSLGEVAASGPAKRTPASRSPSVATASHGERILFPAPGVLRTAARCSSAEPCARLTYRHPVDMVFHMKTTLNIDATVMAQLKREAARQGRTMSELVETALRSMFRAQKTRHELAPLPTFRSGGALVEIADRDALYHAMEGR
jgi:hypothetical protein